MSWTSTTVGSIGAASTLWMAGCAAPPNSAGVTWKPIVCHENAGAVERIRAGRPDSTDPALQAVSVDQAGDVVLVHFANGIPRSEVIYRNQVEFSGLVIADIDATVPGEEIYASGDRNGTEAEDGVVLQIVLTQDAAKRAIVRSLFEGPDFVHSVERVEPRGPGDVARLLVSTYGGEIHLLTPTSGTGPWRDELLHREPPSEDPEARKIKDVAFLRDASGRTTRRALVALKTGRTLDLDVDRPGSTRLVHTEPGGLSRVTADADGGAYITGYFGRVLHFVPTADRFRVDVIDQEGTDSGLRGLVRGDFPVTGETAHMVVFGFHKLCRALVPRQGVMDPVTLYVDIERGHTIEAADVVPGNGADELLLGGYSKRITLLVAERDG